MIFFVNGDNFGVYSKRNWKINRQQIITANIYRIKANDSIKYGCLCIESIDFILKGKILLDHTSLFSEGEYKKNDDNELFSIILD